MVKNSKFFRTFWPTLLKRLGRSWRFCTRLCAGLCPTYWTTFGNADKNRNGRCPLHEWDHPPILEFLTPPPPPHRGRWTPQGREHVGRHCPYTNKIWCGSVHALLRYRSITAKMQKSQLTPIATKISFPPFSVRWWPLTPKRGEDTSGTWVRSHANLGVNLPAGCR